MQGLSKSDLAARLGVHKSRVSQYIRDGLPVLPDGRVDAEAAEAWLAARLDPARQAAARGPGVAEGGGGRLLEARRRKVSAEAERAEMELRLRRGELVERQVIAATLAPWIRELRDAILAAPRDTVLDPVQAAECEAAVEAALAAFAARLAGEAGA
jgi:transcriptional regulator with XRE-family HTH domain